jgi:S1-C subfamily serine protease
MIRRKPAASAGSSWIGATLDSVGSANSAVQLGLPPETRGAVVTAIFGGSPAARAGIKPGDVITSANGRTIVSRDGFDQALRSLKPGDSLTMDVVDQSGPRRATLTVAKRPATLSG